jgi:hypothetical protein
MRSVTKGLTILLAIAFAGVGALLLLSILQSRSARAIASDPDDISMEDVYHLDNIGLRLQPLLAERDQVFAKYHMSEKDRVDLAHHRIIRDAAPRPATPVPK